MKPAESSSIPAAAPSVFSPAFHTRFFPALIRQRWAIQWQRLRNKPPAQTGFHHGGPIDFILVVFGCGILIAIGLPGLIDRHSIVGGVMTFLGAGGLLALIFYGIWQSREYPLTWDDFEMVTFFFFVLLGFTLGWALSNGRWSWAGAGVLAGYVAGLAIGLWQQKLGAMAMLVRWAAAFGVFVLFFTDFFILWH